MRILFCAVLAAGALVATSHAETPYQPRSDHNRYGYGETQIDSNRLRVTFNGDTRTEREKVVTNLLYRAAETTLHRGYDYFVIVAGDVEEHTTYQSTGFRPRFGPADYRERTAHEAVIDIAMFHGAKPELAVNAYDARSVRINLEPRINRPDRS